MARSALRQRRPPGQSRRTWSVALGRRRLASGLLANPLLIPREVLWETTPAAVGAFSAVAEIRTR